MIAKKRLLPILIALLMVFAMMPMTAWTVFADNIDVPKYVVNLTSGSGSGDPTSFNSQQDGRFFGVSDTGAGVANGQFFSTGQVMYIRLPDCPDTFTGQDGTVFIGWQIDGSGPTFTPGTFVEATNPMNLTAFWAAAGDASLSSLTVDNGVLEPQFSPDVTRYSVKIYYEGSPVEVRATATPAQSDATVTYGEEYSCPALGADSSLDIRVTNGANEKTYNLSIRTFYSITTEIEGRGSVKTTNYYMSELGETNTALNGNTFKLVATPSDGWKFKEWQLISGSGTLNYPTDATATYRVNGDNAVVKAIFVPTYTVTFKAAGGSWQDGTTEKVQTVAEGNAATAPAEPTRDGFTFDGWDVNFNNVTSNLTVTAKWKENAPPPAETFTVTFKAAGGTWTDGTTADKQVTVDKGQAATAPDVPTRDGFTFDGWDPEDFSNITSNLTVTAQWIENSEPQPQPAAQTITASNITKTYGNVAFSLGAKTSGDGTLTYKSSNTKVVTVDSAGKVTIKGAGTAKITISVSATENYKAATKTITVTVKKAANPLKMKPKTASVKYKKLKKKTQTLAVTKVIKFTKKLNDKKTYTLVSAKKGSKSFKKYFKINKTTGKVTIKKNKKMKKGTYKVKVKIQALGNSNYKASAVKTVTFKVKVK